LDPAYGFSVSIAIGLLLFIAGLVVSLTLGGDTGVGLIFGIPLLIAGLAVPLFMAREHFTRNDVEGTCPNCGTHIKTSDSTLKLECPKCQKVIAVRDGKLYLDA
jgi:predicted RNA-binding Zn-ribbon protein involved in translation (DUF1610 family)